MPSLLFSIQQEFKRIFHLLALARSLPYLETVKQSYTGQEYHNQE